MGEENSGRIASGFSAEERRWRYGRGEFWQDYVRILRRITPVALLERRILAGLRPDSPQKNASGVMGEENFGRITSGFSAKERRYTAQAEQICSLRSSKSPSVKPATACERTSASIPGTQVITRISSMLAVYIEQYTAQAVSISSIKSSKTL